MRYIIDDITWPLIINIYTLFPQLPGPAQLGQSLASTYKHTHTHTHTHCTTSHEIMNTLLLWGHLHLFVVCTCITIHNVLISLPTESKKKDEDVVDF